MTADKRVDPPAAPPPWLMARSTANTNTDVFAETGREMAGALYPHLVPYGGRVLDFGCGSGRVVRHLPVAWHLEGCDVDAEAITWCQNHLPGRFTHSGLYPPLPYEDGRFGAVIACSVFTHLDRRLQLTWLDELKRVLTPGGVLLASVHGEAARRAYIPLLPTILEDNGIFDELEIGHLAGVAPAGYYRAVFQSEKWTREHWGRVFTVSDYLESGLTPTQDLVICRG